MIIKEIYIIDGELYKEAYDYAELSKAFTSNRHDFHKGGQKNKRLFVGGLYEKHKV